MHKEPSLDKTKVVEQLKKGDKNVMTQVYKTHYATIEKLIINNKGTPQDAKDIYQEAFMVFINKLTDSSFSLTCQIGTYLYSVSRNLWLKELKKKTNPSCRFYSR